MGGGAMGGRDEERARGVGLGRGNLPRAPEAPRPVAHELADVLAKVVNDPGMAPLIATRAGFPPTRLPAYTNPLVFWNEVVGHAVSGAMPMEALITEALVHFPYSDELRALERRVGLATPGTGPTAPTVRLTAEEFASLLDRHSPWGRFRDRCTSGKHLVMWAAGDPRQNLSLFYARIHGELSHTVEHDHHDFGSRLGAGAVATEWERALVSALPGSYRGMTLTEALQSATSTRRAIFLLRSANGVLEDARLTEPYVDELVRFVTDRFVPAAMQIETTKPPVRLFVGIQTAKGQRKAKLATRLRAAMTEPLEKHRERLGTWEEEQIELPTWNDVKASMEELLPHGLPLHEDERDELDGVYDAFRAKKGGTLQQLANGLYPLYEQFHDARTKGTHDG